MSPLVTICLVWLGATATAHAETFDEIKARVSRSGSVTVPCRDGTGAVLKNLPCDGPGDTLLGQVKAEFNKRFDTEAAWFYRGSKIRFSTGELVTFPKPVCNLNAGEIDSNSLAGDSSCGDYCKLQVSKSLTGASIKVLTDTTGRSCIRETAWYNGAWLQAKNFYRKQVLAEWSTKQVSLVDFDGTRPSASVAAAAVDITNMSNGFIADWTKSEGPDQVAQMKCQGNTDQGGASQAGCHMEMLSQRLITGWVLLLGSEMNLRTQKDFINRFKDQNGMMDNAQNAIGSACQGECTCITCSDSELSSCANRCYQREMLKYLKSHLTFWDTGGDYPRAGAQPTQPLSGGGS